MSEKNLSLVGILQQKTEHRLTIPMFAYRNESCEDKTFLSCIFLMEYFT